MARPAVSDSRQGVPNRPRNGVTDRGGVAIHADLGGVAQLVHREFDRRLDPQVVDECLRRVGAKFDEVAVRSFVPLLVSRYVSNELNALLDA